MRLLCTKFDREKNITVCKNKQEKITRLSIPLPTTSEADCY